MNRKLIQIALALLVVSFLLTTPRAPQAALVTQNSPEDRVALYQALLDLTNPWTVMCIAAHPDDEDGTSLIVMRRKYGAHTVSLFSTFGEGGQNAIGPELYEELGAIRARETMAAAEIQGSEPHFLGLKDFGYSKSADEAFKFWGHEEALRRMVLEIRKLRPDVIITNHSVTNNDHGHHQATARLELEAFDAAADPQRFPEQLKDGVTTWQVQRLFVRGGRSNQAQAETRPTVTIDPNEQDPVRGVVYAEEALRALQKHATQGPWPKTFADMLRFRNAQDGKLPLTRYVLTREAKGADAVPKSPQNFLDGLRLPAEVAKLQVPTIDGKPLREFAAEPDRVFDALAAVMRSEPFRSLGLHSPGEPYDSRLERIRERTEAALALAAGVTATLTSENGIVVAGTQPAFVLKLANRGSQTVKISRAGLYGLTTFSLAKTKSELKPGETDEVRVTSLIPNAQTLTVPHAVHLYDGGYAGVRLRGFVLFERASKTVNVPYDLRVDVAPAVDIADISPLPLVIRPDEVGVSSAGADVFPAKLPELKIELINYLDQRFNGEVLFGLKNQREQTRRKIELLPHQIVTIALPMPSPEKNTAAHARSSDSGEALTVTVRATNSRENITTREVPIVRANAHVARGLWIGYVRGFDFSLPTALNALGVQSKELSVDEVKTADLQKYTSIIVDNRVYESQPELIAANQKLLDYANAGGTLIVFYHKSNEWNPDERRKRPQLAPYKLILGDERITDENAPITFIEPQHPLLNSPNKMGQEDFVGWIQERGLYYPKDWDPQFHALLQSNDPGEASLKGGLLVADYGRGHYIYTSMVWYRELRGGVPGAYRMLANMISYGR